MMQKMEDTIPLIDAPTNNTAKDPVQTFGEDKTHARLLSKEDPDNNTASNIKLIVSSVATSDNDKNDSVSLPPKASKKRKEPTLAPKTPRKRASGRHQAQTSELNQPQEHEQKTKKKQKEKTRTSKEHRNPGKAIIEQPLYTPLAQISKVNTPYNIQVRVVKLWYGKLYGRKFPLSMVFIVRDEEGTDMEVLVPDTHCKRYKAIIHEGCTYSIMHVTSGVTNKPFKVLQKTRQLFLDGNTRIQSLEDNGQIGNFVHFYRTLDEVPTLATRPTLLFDIIMYVVDMTLPIGKPLRSNNLTHLVELSAVDKTSFEATTTFTIWEDIFSKYPEELTKGFVRPFLIAVHGVHSKIFLSKPVIESTGFTEITFNDMSTPAARKLASWAHQEYLQKRLEQQNLALTNSSDVNNVTIKDLIDITSKPPQKNEEQVYTVVANLIYVFTDEEMYYESCPECRARAPDGTSNSYKCTACNNIQPRCVARLKIRATIEDATDATNVVLFHRQAQLILHEPVETIKHIKQQRNSTALLNRKIEKCLNIPYKFTIKISNANYKYISPRGYTVSEVERVQRAYLEEENDTPFLLPAADNVVGEESDDGGSSEDNSSSEGTSSHDEES